MRNITVMVRYIFFSSTILFISISSANAAIINNSDTGLAGWSTQLEFDEVSIDQGEAVTNQYQADGVTFEGLLFNPGWASAGWDPDGVSPFLGNSTGSGNVDVISDSWSILFDREHHDVAFSLAMKIENGKSFLLSAYLAESILPVASLLIAPQSTDAYGYYGFTGIVFDRIVMAAGDGGDMGFTLIDNLQFSAVPVPAAIWLFGTALIGLFGFNKRRKAV